LTGGGAFLEGLAPLPKRCCVVLAALIAMLSIAEAGSTCLA
jgi:hypothetical protein